MHLCIGMRDELTAAAKRIFYSPYMLRLLLAFTILVTSLRTAAFDNSRYDNLAVYWGQNSYGATHSDTANYQKTLSFYCNDDTIDVFPIAFLYIFFGPGNAPVINLANTCNPTDNATFPGTNLANCASLASDIETCQAKGKIITISLGGATGSVGFSSDSQAESFAETIWDMFLGGSSSTRPFGNAVLDGIDLDIEGGTSDSYVAFVNRIRSLSSGQGKTYYVTAAPQCVYPDAALGGVLNAADFDAIYVQFYNNPCGLQNFNSASNWDFGIWDNWARTISPNKNVKVYIGAPASSSAAGGGYVPPETLSSIAAQMRRSFPSFGGVMLWDASQAYVNGRYDQAIKNAMVAAGGTGFTFPACSAPAWVSGTAYTGGQTVSFGGYIWEAKWWTQAQPAQNSFGDWSAISACSGGGSSQDTTTSSHDSTAPHTTSTTQPVTSTTTSSTPTTSPSGNCAGIPAWSSSTAYTGGSNVVYDGHLWSAQWWTEDDIPGGSAGVWTDNGPCTDANGVKAESSQGVQTKVLSSPTPKISSRFFSY